jgi:hypothetical protein
MLRTVLFFGIVGICVSAFSQDSLNIRRIGEISLEQGYVTCVAVQGNYVYAGTGADSGGEALWVVDVSDPAHPISTAFDTLSDNTSALGISVAESLAVIASGAGQVDIYDIRDPHAPQHLSNVGEGFGLVWDVAVQGVYAYAARYAPRGMSVVNIAHPENPSIISFAGMNDDPSGLCVTGDYAYVTAACGLHVIDIHDPYLPGEVAVAPDSDAVQVAMREDHAYVTILGGYFSVVDVSIPQTPRIVTYVQTGGYVDGIAAANDHVLVAAGEGGLQTYDVSNPEVPIESGFYRGAISPSKVAVSGQYAFVASENHLEIFDCSAALGIKDDFRSHPSSFSLSAYPNPFNPSTTISFSLPRGGNVDLKVFDVTGRVVRTLADGRVDAGEHRQGFDGSVLPSGVYLVRMNAQGFSQTQRLILIR